MNDQWVLNSICNKYRFYSASARNISFIEYYVERITYKLNDQLKTLEKKAGSLMSWRRWSFVGKEKQKDGPKRIEAPRWTDIILAILRI